MQFDRVTVYQPQESPGTKAAIPVRHQNTGRLAIIWSGGNPNLPWPDSQIWNYLERDGLRIFPIRDTGVRELTVRRLAAWPAQIPLQGIDWVSRLSRVLDHVDAVHVIAQHGWSWLHGAFLPLLGSKYFGKRVTLSFAGGSAEKAVAHYGRKFKPIARLCNGIVVHSHDQIEAITKIGATPLVLPPVVHAAIDHLGMPTALQPRILVVLGDQAEQDLLCAIRTFKLVKQKYPRAELIVPASGETLESANRLIAGENVLGITCAHNCTADQVLVSDSNVDLVFYPSAQGEFPVALLEGAMSGRVVVASDTPSVAEYFQDGKNAALIRPLDVTAFTRTINDLIECSELHHRLIRGAREVATQYTWERQRERWLEALMGTPSR